MLALGLGRPNYRLRHSIFQSMHEKTDRRIILLQPTIPHSLLTPTDKRSSSGGHRAGHTFIRHQIRLQKSVRVREQSVREVASLRFAAPSRIVQACHGMDRP